MIYFKKDDIVDFKENVVVEIEGGELLCEHMKLDRETGLVEFLGPHEVNLEKNESEAQTGE